MRCKRQSTPKKRKRKSVICSGWSILSKNANKAPKRAMAKVKFKAYRDLYDSRDSEEGQKRALRMAKSRNRNSVDVFQAKLIKDKDGKTLTESTEIQQRWKEYFEDLMNIENEREQRTIEANYEEMVEPV